MAHCSPAPPTADHFTTARCFDVTLVNDTTQRLHDATCEWEEDRARAGEMSPGIDATVHSVRPPMSGSIRVSWKTDGGERYQVDVPVKPSYVSPPESIRVNASTVVHPTRLLLIRIRTDHTVSIRGVRDVDYLEPIWSVEGNVFTATQSR